MMMRRDGQCGRGSRVSRQPAIPSRPPRRRRRLSRAGPTAGAGSSGGVTGARPMLSRLRAGRATPAGRIRAAAGRSAAGGTPTRGTLLRVRPSRGGSVQTDRLDSGPTWVRDRRCLSHVTLLTRGMWPAVGEQRPDLTTPGRMRLGGVVGRLSRAGVPWPIRRIGRRSSGVVRLSLMSRLTGLPTGGRKSRGGVGASQPTRCSASDPRQRGRTRPAPGGAVGRADRGSGPTPGSIGTRDRVLRSGSGPMAGLIRRPSGRGVIGARPGRWPARARARGRAAGPGGAARPTRMPGAVRIGRQTARLVPRRNRQRGSRPSPPGATRNWPSRRDASGTAPRPRTTAGCRGAVGRRRVVNRTVASGRRPVVRRRAASRFRGAISHQPASSRQHAGRRQHPPNHP